METTFATRDSIPIVYHGSSFLGGRDRATVTWKDRALRCSLPPEFYERYLRWKNPVENP